MNIKFIPLAELHFPLLLKWLNSEHVMQWWDDGVLYTSELVYKKYASYVKGYKQVDGIDKPIKGYIILHNEQPIGYIQIYNAYDFPREEAIYSLPESLGAIDIFIGEKEYINKGIGSVAIKLFVEEFGFTKYKYIFLDPEYNNEAAVAAYEKAGFVIIRRVNKVFWMVSHKPIVRLSTKDLVNLEVTFKESFLDKDRLWIFGSRTNLQQKGGDIDLYVETYAKTTDEATDMQSKFWSRLIENIGDQKIDIVLNVLSSSCNYFQQTLLGLKQ